MVQFFREDFMVPTGTTVLLLLFTAEDAANP